GDDLRAVVGEVVGGIDQVGYLEGRAGAHQRANGDDVERLPVRSIVGVGALGDRDADVHPLLFCLAVNGHDTDPAVHGEFRRGLHVKGIGPGVRLKEAAPGVQAIVQIRAAGGDAVVVQIV